MTKSSTPQASDVSKPEPKRRSGGWGRALLVLVFRLLLLGVSGSLAALLGIAIAQFYPGRLEEPPLAEKLLQGTQSFTRNVRQIAQPATESPAPEAGSPLPTDAANPPLIDTLPPSTTPASPLSEEQRQTLTTELNQLQGQLQQLNDRAAQLESQVGASNPAAPLEERLDAVQRQLDPNAPPPSPASAPAPPSFIAPAASAIDEGDLLMVTLPSDALFNDGASILRPETEAILNSIVGDLQGYPGATIRVVGHTDSQGATDTDRTFEQATVVQQHLAGQLDDSYHWIVVGAGDSNPLAENTSPVNRQRNRRIEIVIDPRP